MRGLIGQKLGMTQFWREDGEVVPVTVIQGGPCVITQIKTEERDGYTSVQLGYRDKKEKRATKAEVGHFKKANTAPKYFVREFRDLEVGDIIALEDAEEVVMNVAGVPLYRGSLGVSQGNYAVKIAKVVHQPKTAGIRELIEADQKERRA